MFIFAISYYCTRSNQLLLRNFIKQVNIAMSTLLKPPEHVYLMTTLDKNAFEKLIKVPILNLKEAELSLIVPLIKKLFLKIDNFKAISHTDEGNACLYLNPEVVQTWLDIPAEIRDGLKDLNLGENDLIMEDFTLKYDNYNAESILKAVLPKDKEGLSSFTKVGHIVHINLREHLMPYKDVIGEVLFDKVHGCQSVVNKINMIDNTYRNFQMEILKGTDNMLTLVKENNCKFEFDFAKVYWNSRLCTEHERIVKLLRPNDVLFDVFAGVGPFAIPAAKKKCIVYANDLNPESFKWLMHNKKVNKVADEYFKGFNLDGREFIMNTFKENFPKLSANHQVVVTMNLPALAVEFLDAFIGLFEDTSSDVKPITVYVYCFAKGEQPEEIARALICDNLQVKNVDITTKIQDIFKVRTVSSMKEMMRITLKLDKDVLVGTVDSKKRKLESNGNCLKKFCSSGENGQKQEEEQQSVQGSGREEFKNEGESQSCKD